ncbi:hypothetical protein ACWIGW_34010 [Nocardia brasiliensis]
MARRRWVRYLDLPFGIAERNRTLRQRAYAALPPGGRVLVFNAFADDGRGLLYIASDNM